MKMAWGVEPLPEQVHFARLAREVTSQVLSLESSSPALVDLVTSLDKARDQLAGEVPAGTHPRIGKKVDSNGRVYVDHCRDIGGFNPMFPTYDLTVVDETRATGTVNFPIAYEGPAGCVNGGFLAVFFDVVVQQHNCDLGMSGATRDLNVSYRRPTPLLVDLQIEISRKITDRTVYSEVKLLRDEEVLSSATTNAVWVGGDAPEIAPRRQR